MYLDKAYIHVAQNVVGLRILSSWFWFWEIYSVAGCTTWSLWKYQEARAVSLCAVALITEQRTSMQTQGKEPKIHKQNVDSALVVLNRTQKNLYSNEQEDKKHNRRVHIAGGW